VRFDRVIALEPYGRGLLGTTLRYPYEVRNALDYFSAVPELTLAPDLLQLAERILDSKAAAFDPMAFRDRYEEALLAHLKARETGAVQEEKPAFAAPHRVINLMDALRRSIAQDKRSIAPDKKPFRKENASAGVPGQTRRRA
jgi:DNA end-binding protein Ku